MRCEEGGERNGKGENARWRRPGEFRLLARTGGRMRVAIFLFLMWAPLFDVDAGESEP